LLKNGPIARPYTRDMCVREIPRNFVQSPRARKAYYLYSETTTYISSGEDVKGNNMEDKRKQMRIELYI